MHHIVSMAAGFLGAYALILREATFGNSMTSNLIYIFIAGFSQGWLEVLFRILATVIYLAGIGLTAMISFKNPYTWKRLSILIDIGCVIILGFIPMEANFVVALYPIFFCTAIQWNCFPKMGPHTSAPIFSTNNIRQFTQAGLLYLKTKNPDTLLKFTAYAFTLLWFHLGAVYGILAVRWFGFRGVWLCLIPLVLSLFMLRRWRRAFPDGPP